VTGGLSQPRQEEGGVLHWFVRLSSRLLRGCCVYFSAVTCSAVLCTVQAVVLYCISIEHYVVLYRVPLQQHMQDMVYVGAKWREQQQILAVQRAGPALGHLGLQWLCQAGQHVRVPDLIPAPR
jgi:hypothetical protein